MLKLPDGARRAIEIKRSTSLKMARGIHNAAEDLEPENHILVYAYDRDVAAHDSV